MRILAHVCVRGVCLQNNILRVREVCVQDAFAEGRAVIIPENGVTTALSRTTVSSSLMVQSHFASQAVTESGRQYPWVPPPPCSIGARLAMPMPVAISCLAVGMLWIGNS